MPPGDLAPFLMGMTLILSVAGVLILRPLTRRLGDILEAKARAKQPQLPSNEEVERLTDVVSRLTDRIESLEERQDFAERLLTTKDLSGSQRTPPSS